MPSSPVVPVRGLAGKGILKDPSPYQLDIDLVERLGMRFHANKAERAPVLRPHSRSSRMSGQ